jgi:predicted RNase H-like HicB family nuclease
MESMYSIHLKVSKVENGQYVAESEDIPGLVAQGRTITETIEIAQDVARKLIDSYLEHGEPVPGSLKPLTDQIELDVAVGV